MKTISTLILTFTFLCVINGQQSKSSEKALHFNEGSEEAVIVLAYSGTSNDHNPIIEDQVQENDNLINDIFGYDRMGNLNEDKYLSRNSELVDLIEWDVDYFKREIRKTQLEIAKKASNLNKVVIFVKSKDDYSDLENEFDYDFQEKMEDGRISLVLSDFEGPWIRDYGPQIVRNNSNINILDAKYQDSRNEEQKVKALFKFNESKGVLIEEIIEQYVELDIRRALDYNTLELANQIRDNEERVKIYDSYLQYLSLTPSYRNYDDVFPQLLANHLIDVRNFEISSIDLNMDGGNFIRTQNCDCISTYDIIAKNNNNQEKVNRILTEKYLCNRVIYLDPLPMTIKHVDMFLIPFGDNKIILPSFKPDESFLKDHYKELSPLLKTQAIKAEMSMRKNGDILRNYGYEVEYVPGLLPQESFSDPLYYPTIMNVLIQYGKKDGKDAIQILFPYYEEIQEDVQDYSRSKIIKLFSDHYGDNVTILEEKIKCNEVAMLKGAVHCLTHSIPLSSTKYSEDKYQIEYEHFVEIMNLRSESLNGEKIAGEWELIEFESIQMRNELFNMEVGETIGFDEQDSKFAELYADKIFSFSVIEERDQKDFVIKLSNISNDEIENPEFRLFVTLDNDYQISARDEYFNYYSFRKL